MKGFSEKFGDATAAVTFAEAGEHEKAVEIMKEAEKRLDKIKKDFRKEFHVFAIS